MPQELRVVCCFQCRKFQSDIVKKAKKWTCKLCGAQQSLVKEYARGSGRECRLLVQQLSDGSLQADQMERYVAEQVLAGEIELPVAENPIREESDRLVASHEANRKIVGDRESKWNSFCLNEEDEAGDILTRKISSESSSWAYWGKGNVVDHDLKSPENPKHSFAFNQKNQLSTTSKLAPNPMADFHQMDKQDKQQFKWQTTKLNQSNFASNSSIQSSKTIQENKKPLFSFERKASTCSTTSTLEDIDASQSKENIALKRTSDSAELTAGQSPMISYEKKSKWTYFNRPELELNSPIATPDSKECLQDSEPLTGKTQSPASSSKWSKYIPQTDPEDDELT
ncbi:uncharacterized protein LOC135702448 [Ochlerotatus camptorhynchus]|uniref:uncharacterized protein LOC135702448 n=1 Tax=Ochlerotatus camptorhynchus TaxID=644619 RepID=UPI0031D9C3A7